MMERRYRDMGLQIKAIRERLNMTLDAISKETGISRSYISDFERGFKLPTGKFLKHLHDRHNINLNYVFCSDGFYWFELTQFDEWQWRMTYIEPKPPPHMHYYQVLPRGVIDGMAHTLVNPDKVITMKAVHSRSLNKVSRQKNIPNRQLALK